MNGPALMPVADPIHATRRARGCSRCATQPWRSWCTRSALPARLWWLSVRSTRSSPCAITATTPPGPLLTWRTSSPGATRTSGYDSGFAAPSSSSQPRPRYGVAGEAQLARGHRHEQRGCRVQHRHRRARGERRQPCQQHERREQRARDRAECVHREQAPEAARPARRQVRPAGAPAAASTDGSSPPAASSAGPTTEKPSPSADMSAPLPAGAAWNTSPSLAPYKKVGRAAAARPAAAHAHAASCERRDAGADEQRADAEARRRGDEVHDHEQRTEGVHRSGRARAPVRVPQPPAAPCSRSRRRRRARRAAAARP